MKRQNMREVQAAQRVETAAQAPAFAASGMGVGYRRRHRDSGRPSKQQPVSYTHLDVYKRQVTVCEKDGAKALAALSAEKPDAVLLDAFMPGLDALTVKQLDVYKRQGIELP